MKNPTIDSRGNKYWINEVGKFHRENGLPTIEYGDGNKQWHDENGQCYRWDEWIYKL